MQLYRTNSTQYSDTPLRSSVPPTCNRQPSPHVTLATTAASHSTLPLTQHQSAKTKSSLDSPASKSHAKSQHAKRAKALPPVALPDRVPPGCGCKCEPCAGCLFRTRRVAWRGKHREVHGSETKALDVAHRLRPRSPLISPSSAPHQARSSAAGSSSPRCALRHSASTSSTSRRSSSGRASRTSCGMAECEIE